VNLYYDNAVKLATTATGIDVTGTVAAGAGTALLPSITTTGDLNTGMWFPAADTIAFSEGGVEALRINSSGYVGIGTTNPVSQFAVGAAGRRIEIDGGSVIRGFDRTASWAGIDFEASAYTFDCSTARMLDIAATGVIINEDGADADFRVESDTNANALFVEGSSGNVGIGASPIANLSVLGGTSNASNLATAYSLAAFNITPKSTSGYSLQFGSGPGDIPYIQMSAGGAASGNLSIQPYGGDVGIGGSPTNGILEVFKTSGEAVVRINNTGGSSWLTFNPSVAAYLHNITATPMIFTTSGTERMRIDSSGNVGIGKSSPAEKLDVAGNIRLSGGDTYIKFINDGGYDFSIRANSGNALQFYSPEYAADPILSMTNNHNVGIGTTSPATKLQVNGDVTIYGTPSTSVHGVQFRNLFNIGPHLFSQGAATTNTYINWINANGTVGSIAATGSGVAYNTSSDYRLKEDWQLISAASDRVLALKPINFAWIVDGSRVDGFLAHELAEVVPEAVTGTKDAMMDEEYEVTAAVLDDDGNVVTEAVMGTRSVPYYQGIDQSKLVPLLTAALQEALTKIAAMEIRLSALEG
jgi:hypothetical protein